MNQELRIMEIKNKAKSIIHDSSFIIHSGGFTLIELLVAMGIIGILSSFLLANFVGVRQRTRDGVRKFDLRQIQLALENYRADLSSYPSSVPNSTNNACLTSLLSDPTSCNSTAYMKKVPVDPLAGNYSYSSNGSTYSIIACLENGNDSQKDIPANALCIGSGKSGVSYTLQNP